VLNRGSGVSLGGEMRRKLDDLISEMVERGITLHEAIGEFEHRFILKALERNGRKLVHTAKMLGIHRNTLRNKLKAFNFKRR
jgi:DNA-binding NtrC family response regulator